MKVTTTFFSRKNKGGPANVLPLYHGVAGQGIASFKAFPGPFWALSRPAPRRETVSHFLPGDLGKLEMGPTWVLLES